MTGRENKQHVKHHRTTSFNIGLTVSQGSLQRPSQAPCLGCYSSCKAGYSRKWYNKLKQTLNNWNSCWVQDTFNKYVK